MKGDNTEKCYMGYVEGTWMLIGCEADYYEFME